MGSRMGDHSTGGTGGLGAGSATGGAAGQKLGCRVPFDCISSTSRGVGGRA